MLLVVMVIFAGRWVRQEMLVDPQGEWQEYLWLDSLVAGPDAAQAQERPPKPVLTTPLPINTCQSDSLTLLPGVGPVLAARIAAARDSGLVFCTMEDLRLVKGIGQVLSARLDSLVIYANSASDDTLAN
ncbi:MAG: putative flap endonuclease-1-like 5' DNA nuclease [Candidatus Krumholzibacteriia bacterium]|jgi:predicted flap endonuclease-1-like 5' DNA nuclease